MKIKKDKKKNHTKIIDCVVMLRNDMVVCNLDCKRYKGSKAIPNPFVVEV